MKVAFRLDATVAIGSGHLMRCLALADALREQGAQAAFIMHCEIADLQAEVARRGHACRLLPSAPDGAIDWREDAGQTLACLRDLPRPDCLIVDHYQLDTRWETLLRSAADRIMVVDDLADRPHDCDILLDQNFNIGMQTRYAGLVPADCQQLLGPRYAILRPEFVAQRQALRARDGSVRRIAVFFGGTDPDGETLKVLAAIAGLQKESPQFAQLACDVIVGSANPRRDLVEQACGRMPHARFHCQIDYMAQLLDTADLCVGAGGTALWERAVLGLPSLVIAIAANQVGASVAMAQAGALLYMGTAQELDATALQQALAFALADPALLLSLSRCGMDLVDGNGLARVAACVAAA